MFDSLKMVGITPAFIQLFALAGICGFLLLTFWRFFLVGIVTLFLVFSVAVSAKKDNIEIETYIQNNSTVKENIKMPTVPKEFIEDCMLHLKMTEELCKQTWLE
jgi:hypothetical protein